MKWFNIFFTVYWAVMAISPLAGVFVCGLRLPGECL